MSRAAAGELLGGGAVAGPPTARRSRHFWPSVQALEDPLQHIATDDDSPAIIQADVGVIGVGLGEAVTLKKFTDGYIHGFFLLARRGANRVGSGSGAAFGRPFSWRGTTGAWPGP